MGYDRTVKYPFCNENQTIPERKFSKSYWRKRKKPKNSSNSVPISSYRYFHHTERIKEDIQKRMLSDYDVVQSPASVQKYVFQTDILGASEHISSSLRRELESFLRRMGYECLNITSNGFCIEIVFPYLLESDEHDKLDLIMKQFIRDKLPTVRMEMIPNVSRENEEIIKTIVKRESKG